jgi:hypothetical protein
LLLSSYTWVSLLITKFILSSILGIPLIRTTTFDNHFFILIWLVIISLSIIDSLLEGFFRVSCCDLFLPFKFLICVIKFWLWHLKWDFFSSLSTITFSTSFYIFCTNLWLSWRIMIFEISSRSSDKGASKHDFVVMSYDVCNIPLWRTDKTYSLRTLARKWSGFLWWWTT